MESVDFVEAILGLMMKAIKKDRTMLVSGFGKFEVCNKKARRGRNPKTTESLTILPRKVVAFRLSGKLRGEMNPQERRLL
jgi:integration host factor subunit alpha